MKEIYRLHEKATALLELCKQEEERLKFKNEKNKMMNDMGMTTLLEDRLNQIDICERALKRLKYSYMKVLMQIAEL